MQLIATFFYESKKNLMFYLKIDIRTVKDTFISKLLIIENHRKSEVSDGQVVYDFLRNKLHESSVMFLKVN